VGSAAGGENPLFRSFCRFVPFETTQNEVQMCNIVMLCCELEEKERLGNLHTSYQ
jgi:hypothetical protein